MIELSPMTLSLIIITLLFRCIYLVALTLGQSSSLANYYEIWLLKKSKPTIHSFGYCYTHDTMVVRSCYCLLHNYIPWGWQVFYFWSSVSETNSTSKIKCHQHFVQRKILEDNNVFLCLVFLFLIGSFKRQILTLTFG